MSIDRSIIRRRAAVLLAAGLALGCSAAPAWASGSSCAGKPPAAASSGASASRAERAKARAEAMAVKKAVETGVNAINKAANAGRKQIERNGRESIRELKGLAQDGGTPEDLAALAITAQQDLLVVSSSAIAAVDQAKADLDAALAGKTLSSALANRLQKAYDRALERLDRASDKTADRIDDVLLELLMSDDSSGDDDDGCDDGKPQPGPVDPPPAS